MTSKAGSENPLGLGLVMVGAFAIAVAAFLPLDEPTGIFRRVEDNTLIQHGGWMLVALALGIAASGYRVSQGGRGLRWLPTILSVIAAALVVYMANDTDFRTLYPVRPDGTVDSNQPGMVASLGIAIYVAGVGVAAALIGSLILLQTAKQHALDDPLVADWEEAATTKKCPDCAETILVDAKVCKHCGYRFAAAAASSAPSPALATNKPKPAPIKQSSKAPPSQRKPKPTLGPQPDPSRPGGLKGFVQDWKSVPAWQTPPKPQGKRQHK
ncbi:zinc ribbon domain-containing protein [Mycobacterium celatum]|uniref:Zinc ribbon domain-containing protein n=1 Tax=Mycobacterium celatum TaxID=28045 RepID=A0A2G5PNX4_MYCCE|nr:zinc ribbon domain-containing protein [Mycobacterium celatum]PIB79644.1 zinc ribbon domain-containing protein [Mycobacterium celatum]